MGWAWGRGIVRMGIDNMFILCRRTTAQANTAGGRADRPGMARFGGGPAGRAPGPR